MFQSPFRLAAAGLCVFAAVLTVVALLRGGRSRVGQLTGLVQTQQLPLTSSNLEGSSSAAGAAGGDSGIVSAPQPDDVDSFASQAHEVLAKLNVLSLEDTDLEESCGVSLYPCVAKIGDCALSNIVQSTGGTLTPKPVACNCFTRGYSQPIPLPNHPGKEVSCPFQCVDSIMKYTNLYITSANGPQNDLQHLCSSSLNTLGSVEYGNENDYTESEDDVATLSTVPVDDERLKESVGALALYINTQRSHQCGAKPPVPTDSSDIRIVYAKRGVAGGGRSQYRMEVSFGTELFFARVAKLPVQDQRENPEAIIRDNDPDDLQGRYAVVSVTPDPCGDDVADQLAVSASGVRAINVQQLPWKAALHPALEGRSLSSFGLGLKPMPEDVRRRYTMVVDTADFTPPQAYDARDVYAGQPQCLAYGVLDQGSCGSCYAFSSATAYSARLCRFNKGAIGNIVASPQEMMDCTNGCDGGYPVEVFEKLLTHPTVETWCDPYLQKKSTCGGYCSTSNTYSILAGSVRVVGAAGAAGVLQMQLELVKNGPGVVCFDVYDDFQSYSSGVYVRSAGARNIGGHAVTLVGFGEEPNGKGGTTPYWLIQNSWGKSWGLGGYAKIRRGTDECQLETYGMTVVRTQAPAVCPAATCRSGAASTLRSCGCRCTGAWAGADCGTCSLKCQNGGVVDAGCTACSCPPGYFGSQCEGYILASPLASCAGTRTVITLDYYFGGTAKPPTQKSFVGIYYSTSTTTNSQVAAAYLCGTSYSKTTNGGLCPSSGRVSVTVPAKAGSYKLVLARYLPLNEFGQSGYPRDLSPDNTVALYTVLVQSGCTATKVSAAALANSPATLFRAAQAAAAAAAAKLAADMKARLDQVAQLQNQAAPVEQPASVAITGINDAKPIMWVDGPQSQVCFRVPATQNVNPKALVLYIGGADSRSYYPTGLSGAGPSTPLPTTYQGCVLVNIAGGVPSGAYTIKLVDVSAGADKQTMIASKSFRAGLASVGFNSYLLGTDRITLTVGWSIDSDLASTLDIVKLHNSAGAVTYWFYTSCGCQTDPAATARAVSSGTLDVVLSKINAVKGGYTAKLYPGNSAVVAAVSYNWIQWTSIGW